MTYVKDVLTKVVSETPPPYNSVRWKLGPDPDGTPAIYLTLYLENFAQHSTAQQTSIGEWAGVVITKIRAAGIPCYLMRVKE